MNKKIIRCGMAVVCLIAYGVVSASDTVEEQEKKAAETLMALQSGYEAYAAASSLNNKRTYDQVQNNTINQEDDTSIAQKITLPETGIEQVVEGDEDQEEKEDEDRGPEFLNETNYKITSNQCKYPNCGKVFPAGAELITRGMVSEKVKETLAKHVIEHMTERCVDRVCKWCGHFATSPSYFEVHERIHTGERPHKCKECEKAFVQLGNLDSHMRTHTKEKPYGCQMCGKKFTTSSSLKRHMKSHSKNIISENLVEVVGNSQSLVAPLIVEKKLNVCTVCGARFIEKTNFLTHLQAHIDKNYEEEKEEDQVSLFAALSYIQEQSMENEFKCDMCNESFFDHCDLINHRWVHIQGQSNWDSQSLLVQNDDFEGCVQAIETQGQGNLIAIDPQQINIQKEFELLGQQEINASFKVPELDLSPEELQQWIEFDMRKLEDFPNKKVQKFKNQQKDNNLINQELEVENFDNDENAEDLLSLSSEMVIKLTSNQCKYPNCGKVFHEGTEGVVSKEVQKALEEHVIEHMTVHDANRVCKWCGKLVTTPGNLKAHERIHMGEKSFKCKDCEKTFTQPHHLKYHARIHTGERPFKCEFAGCEKTFTRSHHLKNHALIHTGERPFKCEFAGCGETFAQSSCLKTHMRIHTRERPFKCEFAGCEKTFTRSHHLKDHALIHTGERPFKCEFAGCEKASTTSSSLKRHMKSHSKNIIGENLVEVVGNSQSLVAPLINLEEQEKED